MAPSGPDFTAPTADVVYVSPDPRKTAVDAITIVFSEPVIGFDKSDLTLTRNGGANLIASFHTLTTSDGGRTWTLAGLSNRTLVCCLPGSTGACRTAWEGILAEQLDARHRPCNFVKHLKPIEACASRG